MKTTTLTLRRIKSVLKHRFGGVLKAGKHLKGSRCCALELASVLHGIEWTDDPEVVRSFDYRALNDILVPDDVRAEWMTKLLVAYDGSLDWSKSRQQKVADRIMILTVNRLIANLPEMPEGVAAKCRAAKTTSDAVLAVYEAAGRAILVVNHISASAITAGAASASAIADDETDAAFKAAEWAASAAAYAASAAADAAAYEVSVITSKAASQQVFITACQLWLDAAKS